MGGCPDPDRDGDAVVDRLDNCPDDPGTPEHSGCRTRQLVSITGGKIELLDRVFFRTNRARVRTRSHALLRNVANVLANHPEITRIRVEGHTDDRGPSASNQRLSQRRAERVVRFLVKAGVERSRLEAVGFGEARPIADNRTNDGRSTNRRVEFVITGKASSEICQVGSRPSEDTADP
jgi:outer membrane protein OmpA-like peptidoglycan-associated protein